MINRFHSIAAAIILSAVTAACGDAQGGQPAIDNDGALSLIDHDQWELVPADADPFAAERTDDSFCDTEGYVVEDLGGARTLGIVTADCNFMSLEQPSRAAITAGDTLRLRIFHFELIAPEPAEAHVAVMVGEDVVAEDRVPIPSESGLVEVSWEAAADADEGSRIVFHLHNHGTNTWNLIDVAIVRE